jgi:hypothetical protein
LIRLDHEGVIFFRCFPRGPTAWTMNLMLAQGKSSLACVPPGRLNPADYLHLILMLAVSLACERTGSFATHSHSRSPGGAQRQGGPPFSSCRQAYLRFSSLKPLAEKQQKVCGKEARRWFCWG